MLLLLMMFSVIYISRISSSVTAYREIKKGSKILGNFIFAYEHRTFGLLRPGMDYRKQKEKLMGYCHVISKYVSEPRLSYGRPDGGIYECSVRILNKMKMLNHSSKAFMLSCINPITAIKPALLFPVGVAQKLGFALSNFGGLVTSVFAGVITDVISHYVLANLDQICSLVETFLHGIQEHIR